MFRLFDMLGRTTAMRTLDDALRRSGVHPLLVPDPVKLTVIQLTKKRAEGVRLEILLPEAARMLAYCILGRGGFEATNGAEDADALDERLDAALDAGDTLDAKLVLLSLHAGLICAEIADRIDAEDF